VDDSPVGGDSPADRGLLDTSVVIDLDAIDFALLPADILISALTLAELTSGPLAATDQLDRARRQDRLQRFESGIDSVPFDARCARAYGPVYVAVANVGRKPRGPRAVDLMIAATALAHGLPLYTLNADDFRGLKGLVEVVDLRGSGG
jgi:predicted nucleic acid-binding protein